VAAVAAGRVSSRDRTTAVVVSGANIDVDKLSAIISSAD
jgi:threonine dehydratase